jgi:hypothetical protein
VIPIWTLKLGAVTVTLASTAGFWHYVTGHVHPVRAPLKPKVEQPVDDTVTKATTGWDMSGMPMATPTAAPVIVKTVVVVQGPQQQIQSSAALGASWVSNQTGQRPVTASHVS